MTTIPSPQHHHNTITTTPSPQHHHRPTITITPSPQHHHHNTITTTPSPPHHHHNTITTTPSPQHHHHNTDILFAVFSNCKSISAFEGNCCFGLPLKTGNMDFIIDINIIKKVHDAWGKQEAIMHLESPVFSEYIPIVRSFLKWDLTSKPKCN